MLLTTGLALHGAIHLAFHFALADRVALVVLLLAARQRQLDLGAPVLEVEAQRHQGEAAFFHFAGEARDLIAVQEQLAGAHRLVAEL